MLAYEIAQAYWAIGIPDDMVTVDPGEGDSPGVGWPVGDGDELLPPAAFPPGSEEFQIWLDDWFSKWHGPVRQDIQNAWETRYPAIDDPGV